MSWWPAISLSRALAALVLAPLLLPVTAAAQDAVRVYAAGSLRAAFSEIADRFTAQHSIPVRPEFGASGALRDRLERGESADVFASANMDHPTSLAASRRAGPVVLFAGNELCALARDGLTITSASLLDVILDPAIKLATSTPKVDPSGDYAWETLPRRAGNPGAARVRRAHTSESVSATRAPTEVSR